jgi:hypothetical protein
MVVLRIYSWMSKKKRVDIMDGMKKWIDETKINKKKL